MIPKWSTQAPSPPPALLKNCEAWVDVERNSNMDDERDSNESKLIMLVPAHISIPGSFLCWTICHMISHQPWNRDPPVGTGDGIHDLSPWWDLLPVADHMIGQKQDLTSLTGYLGSCQSHFRVTSNTFQRSPGKIIIEPGKILDDLRSYGARIQGTHNENIGVLMSFDFRT